MVWYYAPDFEAEQIGKGAAALWVQGWWAPVPLGLIV